MFAEVRHVYNKGGIRAFYKGFFTNFMKVAPAVGISYVVYEHVKSMLGMDRLHV